jgi:hypothetical protein
MQPRPCVRSFGLVWTLLFLAISVPWSGKAEEQPKKRIESFQLMKFGFFVHYVWGGTAYPATVDAEGRLPGGLDDLAERFDSRRFARDLKRMKAEYVIFTAWHANMNCLWPCPPMERWLPGHSSRRDVLREMICAAKSRGIPVILYTHPSDGHDLTPAERAATGWGPAFDFTKWNDFICDVYGDLCSRYGGDIEGLYLDENGGRNGKYVDYSRLRRTILGASPNLFVLQNDYGRTYNCDLGDREVFSFDSTDGNCWAACAIPSSVLLSFNWWASRASAAYAPRYSPESIFRYTVLKAGVESSAGGTAWAAGVYPDGGWENGVLETMRQTASYLKPVAGSVLSTRASCSYVTPSESTIQSLAWGVATQSADGSKEYLHVLKAPDGKVLRLPPPRDGKHFRSARLLGGGRKVSLKQDQTGLVLSLPANAAWDRLDTVIELRTESPRAVSRRLEPKGTLAVSGPGLGGATGREAALANSPTGWGPTPGMARWFDASRIQQRDGSRVNRWQDLSGNEADALPLPSPSRRPVFLRDAGTGAGLGAVRFEAEPNANPALTSQALGFRADLDIRCVFAVFKGSSFLLTDYGAVHFHRPDDENASSPLWDRTYTSMNILGGRTWVNGQSVDGVQDRMPTNLHGGFNLVEVLATNGVTASGFNKDRNCHAGNQCLAEVLLYAL